MGISSFVAGLGLLAFPYINSLVCTKCLWQFRLRLLIADWFDRIKLTLIKPGCNQQDHTPADNGHLFMPRWHCKYFFCLDLSWIQLFQTALFLPETLFKHLPNTLEEGETFGTNFNIFSCPSNSRWANDFHLWYQPNKLMSSILCRKVLNQPPCLTFFNQGYHSTEIMTELHWMADTTPPPFQLHTYQCQGFARTFAGAARSLVQKWWVWRRSRWDKPIPPDSTSSNCIVRISLDADAYEYMCMCKFVKADPARLNEL